MHRSSFIAPQHPKNPMTKITDPTVITIAETDTILVDTKKLK